MRQRHETPTAFNSDRSPIHKNKKIDNTSSLTERERAMQALEMMRQLEKERRKKMVTVRIDERTIISADKKRIQEIAKTYKKN